MHTVYILFSEKLGRYYVGYTTNFEVRLDFHLNDEQAQKYTYKADDWKLYFKIDCLNKQQALSVEKHIKKMKSKTYLINLVKYPEITQKLLGKYL